MRLSHCAQRSSKAQAHGKKKEIDGAQNAVQESEKKVEDLEAKRNAIRLTVLHDEIGDYTYSQITNHIKVIVGSSFASSTVPAMKGAEDSRVQRESQGLRRTSETASPRIRRA